MLMFTDCSGPCIVCSAIRGRCFAGHGDDDFFLASRAQLEESLRVGHVGGNPEHRKLNERDIKMIESWLPRAR